MKRALLLLILIAASAEAQHRFIVVGGSGSGGGEGSGTVTSVTFTAPAQFTVTGSPVSTAGTIALAWASAAQGTVFAGPCSGSGTPVFRALCAADIPALDPTKITGTAVITTDSRLSNARTPTTHASTHAVAGSDAVTLAQSQVASLVSDLAGKQATGDYITATTGDVVAAGPGSVVATIQANSVALGTDTTGGYAGSSTEGGAATSANALQSATTTVDVSAAAAPTAGQVLTATSGTAATWQAAASGSGDVVGPSSATDNALARYDGTTGKLMKSSGILLANNGDLSGATDILTMRRGTNGQRFRLYNTDDGAGNSEYTDIGWISNAFWINFATTGGGTPRNAVINTGGDFYFQNQGSNVFYVGPAHVSPLVSATLGLAASPWARVYTNSVQYVSAARPTCDSAARGTTWYVAGGAGVADTFEVCTKDAADAYAWRALY